MAVIVVGGGGRGAGKTALVCGLMRALPEISWTAVKITTHEHGKATPIWEETTPGETTDTARYLAAGARRALLVTAGEDALGQDADSLGPIVEQILRECGPQRGVIFESNSVLRHVRPDVCLCAAIESMDRAEGFARSFAGACRCDGRVGRTRSHHRGREDYLSAGVDGARVAGDAGLGEGATR